MGVAPVVPYGRIRRQPRPRMEAIVLTARAGTTGPDLRLRWWAVALPAVAFAALLALLLTGTEAGAAGQRQPIADLTGYVWFLL